MPKHTHNERLDDAARAAWLYYVAQNTQDEIAEKMGVSRQSAQRLVALATRERLVKFRLDHPIAECMALAQRLKDRYGLDFCEVTLVDPTSDDPALGIAQVAAAEMEKIPQIGKAHRHGLGNRPRNPRGGGTSARAMNCPQHKVVSLVGSLAPDGSANVNDPITVIGDATRAPRHPLAVPLLATSKEERDIICAQKPIRMNIALAQSADVAFIGIGELNDSPPLLNDGFITRRELDDLQAAGGAGEIIGWAFDDDGILISFQTNDRVASVPLRQPPDKPIIGVARGQNKVRAIRGALAGQWITGLITDEIDGRNPGRLIFFQRSSLR